MPVIAAVADGDQEALGRDGGQPQHALGRVGEIDTRRGRRGRASTGSLSAERCMRGGLPKQHVQRQVDGAVVEVRVLQREVLGLGRLDRPRRRAQRSRLAMASKASRSSVPDGQHVALLASLHQISIGTCRARRWAPRAASNVGATVGVVDELRQGVGQAAGAHVVDRQTIGLSSPSCPASVDDLLAAALDLRVGALHRGEVEVSALEPPEAMDDAAPPPRPMSMAGPPSTTSLCDPAVKPRS